MEVLIGGPGRSMGLEPSCWGGGSLPGGFFLQPPWWAPFSAIGCLLTWPGCQSEYLHCLTSVWMFPPVVGDSPFDPYLPAGDT